MCPSWYQTAADLIDNTQYSQWHLKYIIHIYKKPIKIISISDVYALRHYNRLINRKYIQLAIQVDKKCKCIDNIIGPAIHDLHAKKYL